MKLRKKSDFLNFYNIRPLNSTIRANSNKCNEVSESSFKKKKKKINNVFVHTHILSSQMNLKKELNDKKE